MCSTKQTGIGGTPGSTLRAPAVLVTWHPQCPNHKDYTRSACGQDPPRERTSVRIRASWEAISQNLTQLSPKQTSDKGIIMVVNLIQIEYKLCES